MHILILELTKYPFQQGTTILNSNMHKSDMSEKRCRAATVFTICFVEKMPFTECTLAHAKQTWSLEFKSATNHAVHLGSAGGHSGWTISTEKIHEDEERHVVRTCPRKAFRKRGTTWWLQWVTRHVVRTCSWKPWRNNVFLAVGSVHSVYRVHASAR